MVEGDEACGEAGESLVDVSAPLVANWQPVEAAEPSMGPLHHLAVAAEPLAAVDAVACDVRRDLACAELPPAGSGIVGLVSVQLVGVSARPAQATTAQPRAQPLRVE